MKAICGIMRPTEGLVTVKGDISPLIELGIGFNGQLTAEENVYLYGAMLGHNKRFMREKYDSIVAFSELKDFMEMPVKNFSTGMRARLGFAVATLVNPEILVVDEILAVGDAAFREKCENRMTEMLSEGTTLLLVSHTESTVKKMCSKAVWLNKGVCMASGDVQDVYEVYNKMLKSTREDS
jgi:lipopolysaccharide transport system ATP-binding protein